MLISLKFTVIYKMILFLLIDGLKVMAMHIQPDKTKVMAFGSKRNCLIKFFSKMSRSNGYTWYKIFGSR